MRRQLECLAVLKKFTGHEIQLVPTFFNVLYSIFSDIPCLDQSIICAAIPCALRFVSVVTALLCRFGIGVLVRGVRTFSIFSIRLTDWFDRR